jgi:hypothetical protein
MEPDKQFEEYVRRTQAMHRLTKDHVINSYWPHAAEIQRNGFVAFILRGALAWESESRQRITSPSGAVWLQSDHYDPEGRHIAAKPVRLHMQLNLNLNDVWGGLRVTIDQADEIGSRDVLKSAVSDIALASNLASFLTGTSLSWLPARYLQVRALNVQPPLSEVSESIDWRCLPLSRDPHSHNGSVVNDLFVEKDLLPLFESIRSLSNAEWAGVLRRALSWHASGNCLGSGLNRFVNYWETIELMGHFLYSKLPFTVLGVPSKAERQSHLRDIFAKDLTDATSRWSAAEDIARLVRPSARAKLEAVLPILFRDSSILAQLFSASHEGSKSLYQIRNDIVHGNVADHEVDFTDLVSERLYEMQQLSEAVVTAVLRTSSELEELLAPDQKH